MLIAYKSSIASTKEDNPGDMAASSQLFNFWYNNKKDKKLGARGLRQGLSKFILDNGASVSMVNDSRLLHRVTTTSVPIETSKGPAAGVLTGVLKLFSNGGLNGSEVSLPNCLFCNSLPHNIVSVPQLTGMGYTVTFTTWEAAITNEAGEVLAKACRTTTPWLYELVLDAEACANPLSLAHAQSLPDWDAAAKAECQSLLDNDVFELVDSPGPDEGRGSAAGMMTTGAPTATAAGLMAAGGAPQLPVAPAQPGIMVSSLTCLLITGC